MENKLDIQGLYIVRMVTFLEEEPQSNVYSQIMFNRVQFKQFSDFIAAMFKNDEHIKICKNQGCEGIAVLLSEKKVTLPDYIEDIHRCATDVCNC